MSHQRQAIVLMAVALALVAMVGAAAASQNWYLSSNNPDPYVMYRGSANSEYCSDISIGQSGEVIWRADEPASTDVTFTGDWNFHIYATHPVDPPNRQKNFSIGVWNATTGWTSYGSVDLTTATGWTNGTITGTSFTVHTGEYLSFRMYNVGEGAEKTITVSPCISYVTSPSTDPGYPIPELATVVLFGAGLLALVGYIAYRKRS